MKPFALCVVPVLVAVLMVLTRPTTLAQINTFGRTVDFTGEYVPVNGEAEGGDELGDYAGLPINEAAQRRALAWDASSLSQPEWQCRPQGAEYIVRSPQSVRFWRQLDPITRNVESWNVEFSRTAPTYRQVFMDGRSHPSEFAAHTWRGFSTGKWEGNALVITTTHLKESLRRNGVPRSDKASLTEYITRRGNLLSWVTITVDPVYFTEPLVLTRTYNLSLNLAQPPFPCDPVIEVVRPRGTVAHILPGLADSSAEFAKRRSLPIDAARGGALTMYPEYGVKLNQASATSSAVSAR